jgi:pimeloyl-ACP methyl ester carboxylesterase
VAEVRKLSLTVPRPEGDVPAVLWLPASSSGPRPLVLLGHGGGLDKETRYIDRLATSLADLYGFACLAIDLPFHGERTPAGERGLSALVRRDRMGLRGWRERNASATGQAVADWQAAMAAAEAREGRPYGPVGYFGVSMGTRFGIPLIAAEPRITAAVLGLFGVPAADIGSEFARAARQVTIPVLFLQQLDDRLFPRDDGDRLFALLGSADKTLHANPGGHLGLPPAEFRNSAQFLRHHLGGLALLITSLGPLARPGRMG